MPEIKTRETVKDIKILDKASVAGERMKQAFIRSKDTAQNLMDNGRSLLLNMLKTRSDTRRRTLYTIPDTPSGRRPTRQSIKAAGLAASIDAKSGLSVRRKRPMKRSAAMSSAQSKTYLRLLTRPVAA